jgi:CheY-like chemotaxis protein
MSDDSRAIVPVGQRGVVASVTRQIAITEKLVTDLRKRSDLVKRGLEFVKKHKKRQLEVVIGNGEVMLTKVISGLVRKFFENKYDLKVRSFFYGEELLEQAENGSVDIFILILTNIRFRPVLPGEERIQTTIKLITQIKNIYHVPVIVLTTFSQPSLVTRAKQAGADFFVSLPFEHDDLKEAIEKCLDMLPGFDEVSRKRLKEIAGHNIT